MEAINRHNYEAFFLDYHEGQLSREQMAEVVLFIESHDDLMEEFYEFSPLSLDPTINEKIIIDKKNLYQGPVIGNRSDYFIGLVENDLSVKEQAQLEEFLEDHPQFNEELKSFESTILKPQSIVYPNKRSLKKSGTIIPLFKYAVPVAAAIAFILLLQNSTLHQDYHPSTSELADVSLIEIGNDVEPVRFTPVVADVIETPVTSIEQAIPFGTRSNRFPIEKIEVKSASLVAVRPSTSIKLDNTEPEIIPTQIQQPKAVPTTLLAKATQFADHKLNGTPKPEATAKPLTLLEKSIAKMTKKETAISKEQSNSRKRFSIKIGGFGFSRSKSKKN